MADPIHALRQNLAETRTRYSRVELKLAQALPTHHAGHLIEALVGHSEEFGVDSTASVLRSNPKQFGLTPAQAHSAIPLLAELAGLSETIDRLAAEETHLRQQQDPSHRPVYYAQNRPFLAAPDGRQVTFVDSGETVSLVLVEPQPNEPEPTPEQRPRRRMRM